MLENRMTSLLPEEVGPHLDKPLVYVRVVDAGKASAPCNSELHQQAELAKKGRVDRRWRAPLGYPRLLSPMASAWATRA